MTPEPDTPSVHSCASQSRTAPARDGEEIPHQDGDQDWFVSWHPSTEPPDGTPHGAAGLCVSRDGEIVVVSQDGERWELPGGRPEGQETPEETLGREVLEEACATVVRARLLGFGRGRCIAGPEAGLVLVRSLWRADVEPGAWEPWFETLHRRLVPPADLLDCLTISDGMARIISRGLQEAGISYSATGDWHR